MFKYKFAKFDEIPEAQRAFYLQGSDGAWYLQVEGAVEKARLDEFRTNNVELLSKLERFKGIDPEKVQEILANEQKIAEKKFIDAGDIDGLVAQRTQTMKTDFETKYGTLTKQYETASRQLEVLLIDNDVRANAIKVGIAPTAVDDVLLRAKTVFSVQDGRPVAKDAQGNLLYGKDGQTSMSVGEWIGGLKEQAPHLFQPSQGSGSTNLGRGNGSGSNGQKLSPTSKIAAGMQEGNSPFMN